MTNPEFIEEKPMCLAEAKNLLEEMEKRDAELNYRSNKAKEYLDMFAAGTTKKGKELLDKLLRMKI